MKFDEFKPLAIAYLSEHRDQTTRQIADGVCPTLNAGHINPWLKKLSDSGVICRKRDDRFVSGCRYLYSVVESSNPEVIDTIPDDVAWEMVLKELLPFASAFFRRNVTRYGFGSNPVFDIPESLIKIAESQKFALAVAIAAVFGGNPKDYRITFGSPAIELGAEKVEESTAPVVDSIPNEIKSEFNVKSDGSTTVTLRGAARLLGIDPSLLSRSFGDDFKRSGLAQTLASKGFQVLTFAKEGIPDTAFGFISEYYAFDAGKWCKPQAKSVYRAFASIGVRTWIQNELGWKPQALAKTSDLAVSDNLNALVLSIQGLATSAQSQQAMINDQQSAIRDVIAGLNHIGQSIQVHGEKIHEHDSKIVEFDNYIQQQETLRKNAMKSVLGVKPTVEAPPKDPRAQLIHLVNNYVFAKGLGKEGHGKTWAHLYRDIELRCHCSLEVERKKLESNGMKSPKKIDAVESLGLIDVAVAIAYEVLEVA